MGYLRRIIDVNPQLVALAKKLYGMGLYKCVNPFPAPLPERTAAKKQLIVDVTTLSSSDYGTGIQRVVKKLYEALNAACQYGPVKMTTVYAPGDRPGYFLAPFNNSCLGTMFLRGKEPLAIKDGDVFLGLDFAPDVILAQRATLKAMAERAMPLFFLVHDLLPVRRPDWFSMGTKEVHAEWLKKIAILGEPVCVSRTVRGELAQWLKDQGMPVQEERLHWIHNGCDPEDFRPHGFMRKALLPDMPYMLVVSTVEPRKGHSQILDAFELLWSQGIDLSLVFAGKEGWLMQKTADRINNHPELDKRLLWLQDLNDAELGQFYKNAEAILAASFAEGFGLSLIEGACHGIPLIVRDLPVFREVAGTGAFYFKGDSGADLAKAIMDWQAQKAEGKLPDPQEVRVRSWKESADMLLDILVARTDLRFECPKKYEAR